MSRVKKIIRDIKLAELLGSDIKGDSKKIKEFFDGKLQGLISCVDGSFISYTRYI